MNYLTSLRGIAACCVLLYHLKSFLYQYEIGTALSFLYEKGYLAVDFFFLLSGFILAYNYSKVFFDRIDFATYKLFLIKRIARIYPLHLFVLTLFLVIPLAHFITERSIDSDRYSLFGFFAKAFLIDTWLITTDYWDSWNTPSWTISGEFFAYLLLPIVLFLFPKKIKHVFILFFTLIILVALIYEVLGYAELGYGINTVGIFRCFAMFCCGVCLFSFVEYFKNILSNRAAILITWFAVALSIFLGVNFSKNHMFIPLLFSIILFGTICSRTPIHHFLESKLLVYLGEISYSLYLNHMFVIAMYMMLCMDDHRVASPVDLIAMISLSLTMSHLTYQYVEKPGRSKIVDWWYSKKVSHKVENL